MSRPQWWHELAAEADEHAARFSAAWYEAFCRLYDQRFPDADQTTRDNLRTLAASAAMREGVLFEAIA